MEARMAAQRLHGEDSEDEFVSFSDEEGDPQPEMAANQQPQDRLEETEEYHTDESNVSDDETKTGTEGQSGTGFGPVESDPPLLPPELLKPLPDPALFARKASLVPLAQMTRKQRRLRKAHERKFKKDAYDRLREASQGTGVLQVGEAAQAKREGRLQKKSVRRGVLHGRVEKTRRPEISGLAQMINERKEKLAVGKEMMRLPKDGRKSKNGNKSRVEGKRPGKGKS